jgi:hypothetical protein
VIIEKTSSQLVHQAHLFTEMRSLLVDTQAIVSTLAIEDMDLLQNMRNRWAWQ